MTLPVLARARRVIVAGFGATKAGVIHDALHGRGAGDARRRAPAPGAFVLWCCSIAALLALR